MIDREAMGTLYGALAAARLEFGVIVKDKTARIQSDKSTYTYTFADLAAVIEATAGILAKHGLVIIQEPEVIFDANGIVVMMHGCIAHAGGEVHPLRPLPMPVGRPGDARAIGSAISYARRYQLSAALNIAADADDDAAPGATQTPATRQQSPAAQQRTHNASAPRTAPSVQPPPTRGEGDLGAQANPLEDAPQTPRGDIGEKTTKRLHILGREVYGEEWDIKRPELITSVTKGAATHTAELMETEARKLCAGMEAKLAMMRQPDAA